MGLVEYIGSIGGIAGIFAVAILLIYRQDRKASEDRQREDRKFMEDRQSKTIQSYNEAITENTKVLSELYTWLRGKNGHN